MPIDPETQQRREEELRAMEEFEAEKKFKEAARRAQQEEENTEGRAQERSNRQQPEEQKQQQNPQEKFDQAKNLKNKLSGRETHQGAEAGGRGLSQGLGKQAIGQVGKHAGSFAGRALSTGSRQALLAGGRAIAAYLASIVALIAAKISLILGTIFGVGCFVVIFLAVIIVVLGFLLFAFFGGSGGTGEASTPTGAGSGSAIAGAPRGCPVIGYITTPYGRNIPGYGYRNGTHYGVDIDEGGKIEPVYSSLAGDAALSESSGGGYMVTVTNSASGYAVKFLHLERAGRISGPVKVGDVIGIKDNSGSATTGVHLHYEVYFNNRTVNPADFMPIQWYQAMPANDDFTGIGQPSGSLWGRCDSLPQNTVVPGALSCLEFAGNWTEQEKNLVNEAVAVPARSATWASLVCNGGTVTLTRVNSDPGFNAEVDGGRGMRVYDPLFGNGASIKTTTDAGRVFVLTHELSHVLWNVNPNVKDAFLKSEARVEFDAKGLIRSYPLCRTAGECNLDYTLSEDFAEMAGNYVSDREGSPIDFPIEYPRHNDFAKFVLFGGTTF